MKMWFTKGDLNVKILQLHLVKFRQEKTVVIKGDHRMMEIPKETLLFDPRSLVVYKNTVNSYS